MLVKQYELYLHVLSDDPRAFLQYAPILIGTLVTFPLPSSVTVTSREGFLNSWVHESVGGTVGVRS